MLPLALKTGTFSGCQPPPQPAHRGRMKVIRPRPAAVRMTPKRQPAARDSPNVGFDMDSFLMVGWDGWKHCRPACDLSLPGKRLATLLPGNGSGQGSPDSEAKYQEAA